MSSTSKYAGLPDIDSAPDVYETPDVPPDSTYTIDSDSDSDSPQVGRSSSPATQRRLLATSIGAPLNDNIVDERLDTAQARKRFSQSGFPARIEKQYDARRRRLPTTSTYEMRTSASASAGLEGTETPLERLRRLRSEVTELEDEVRKGQLAEQSDGPVEADSTAGASTGSASKGKGRAAGEVTPQVILQQLQLLRGDLSALNLEAKGSRIEGQGDKVASGSAITSDLINRLGQPTQSQQEPPKAQSTVAERMAGPHATEAQLEKRLADLERLIGASEADVDEALPTPLLPSVARMSHLLTLLTQPRHLDSISRRVKVLVSDLERLHEARRKLGDTRPLHVAIGSSSSTGSGGAMMTVAVPGADGKLPSLSASTSARPPTTGTGEQLSPDALQRVDALFALLPRLDPLLPLTPRLLARLRSLSSLHASSATFKDDLEVLKVELGRVTESEQGLKEVVEGLEASLKDNEEKMKGNLQGLEARVSEVLRRMDQLQ